MDERLYNIVMEKCLDILTKRIDVLEQQNREYQGLLEDARREIKDPYDD